MSILTILEKLFPFLFSAAKKTFDQLEEDVQTAGINGSVFAQIIKDNTTAAYTDVENLIKSKLNLSDGEAEELFKTIREKYNIPDALRVVVFFQNKFSEVTDDILHNSLANEIAAVVSIVLSKGKLTWLTLAAGVLEYIYRKFVKDKEDVVLPSTEEVHNCAPGEYWDTTTQSCQPKIGPGA